MKRFVSRAGEKLERALESFQVSPKDLVCADFGASTGGFTGVLLESGAAKVYAVDTAYGELDWVLRKNTKVVVLERTNAMHVRLPEKMDLITIDVGWTRQKNILPNAFKNLKAKGKIISLIKPHYEAPKRFLTRGKLLEDKIDEVVKAVERDIILSGGRLEKLVRSPLTGQRRGNVEFLALISKN